MILRCLVVVAVALQGAAGRQAPKALLINLPRHKERFDTVKAQLDSAGVAYERAPACDGSLLTEAELRANVTAMGRVLCTKGMIGCFLSHRKCWQRAAEDSVGDDDVFLVFEDDVVLSDDFTARLNAALDDLPADWDVMLLGALGAVHPKYYHVNIMHAAMAGGLRRPRWRTETVHEPLRPFGTHAYALSKRGARKMLAAAPRASYHVDVVAWGLRRLRLFCIHPLLAKQTHGDTTIGGVTDRSWIPEFVIDPYTGADFAWAWNAPLLWVPPFGLLTSGRCFFVTIIGMLTYAYTRSAAVLYATLGFVASLMTTIKLLTWPQAAPHVGAPPAAAAAVTA